MPSDYNEYRESQEFLRSIEESERKLRIIERAGTNSLDDGLLPDGAVYTPSDDSPF